LVSDCYEMLLRANGVPHSRDVCWVAYVLGFEPLF